MSKKKPIPKNILVYADFDCTTGFGNVSHEIITRLSKEYPYSKFHIYALNNPEPKQYDYSDNITVYPSALYHDAKYEVDLYGRLGLCRLLNNYDVPFDLFFMINDIELACSIVADLKATQINNRKINRKNFKSIFYFPVDSAPKKEDLKCLEFFDEIITYTQYAKNEVIKLIGSNSTTKKLRIINHGVNTDIYKPFSIEEKKEIREELFPGVDFVIGSVNRNSPRKDIGTLLIAYSKFLISTKAENTVLYLHMNALDPSGINLVNLCERLGLKIGKNVLINPNHSENRGISEKDLNILYNTFDLFITTTTAEGWGLTVTESMAACVPVMCPLHTSLIEITENGTNAIAIRDIQECVFKDEAEKIRFRSNPTQVGFMIENFYNIKIYHPEQFQHETSIIKYNAYAYVSKLTWGKIAGQFKIVFDKYL